MKNILFTADPHINIPTRVSSLTTLTMFIKQSGADAVVVAGDIGTPGKADDHLRQLREAVGDIPLAITLGNHDMWTGSHEGKDFHILENTIAEFWEKPCRDNDITLLEVENADWGDAIVVGTYGHFNLGLAWPELVIDGVSVTESHYLAGRSWNDFRFIPRCAEFMQENACRQAEGIGRRLALAESTGKRILVATHTCPWAELNGWPRTGAYTDIFTGYSGNTLVGDEIKKRSKRIEFLMCGHTHYLVEEKSLHGIPSLNIGSDYGSLRCVLYGLNDKSIKWL